MSISILNLLIFRQFIVINGYKDMKEVFVKNSVHSAGRPGLEMSLYKINPKSKGLFKLYSSIQFFGYCIYYTVDCEL